MSIRIMTMVYERKLGDPSLKAVLLKLADYANDKGGNIWPAVETVAAQVEVSPRTVQRMLKVAKKRDLLVVEQAGGNGAGNTSRYCINLTQLEALPRVSDDLPEEGCQNVTLIEEGCHSVTLKGDNGDIKGDNDDIEGCHGVTQSIKEPSKEKKKTRSEAREDASSDFQFDLDEDWSLPDAWRRWAIEASPGHAHQITAEATKFLGWWLEKDNPAFEDGWLRRWKNWWERTIARQPSMRERSKSPFGDDTSVRNTDEPIELMIARCLEAGTFTGPVLKKYEAAVERYRAQLRKEVPA